MTNLERATPKVLVVDDDKAVRHPLELRLAQAGYTVRTVACGEDALLAFSPYAPDVVVLDVSLPGMDGYTVCERLHQAVDRPVAIIFLTGTARHVVSANFESRVDQSGGDYFLAKPYDPTILVGMIDHITIGAARTHVTARSAPEKGLPT